MGDNVLKLTTELSTKGVEKGFKAIKKGTLSTAKAVNKAIDGITSVFKKVLSLAAIKKVFDQFKQYLDSSLKKNQEYAASMRALKGSIAAAFQPIYEIAAPAIIHLVQLLNMVVQAIGRFIAALSGKSYSQMLKNAQALSKQKDMLNGVGGAAKDAARQLMSFDEINRLEDNSGGGGSGMTFNEVDLGSATGAIDDFASKLRELLQNGQFEQAGEMIAQNVNKMLEAFDIEKLGSTVGKWTTNFVDFLNGLIFNIDWNQIGGKLANGIDSLLANVDGKKIGKLLTAKFSIAIRMISGFFKELDGGQVGATLGDAILGFAQSLGQDISTNFDAEFWDKLNQNISDGFDAFVPRFIGVLKVAVDTIIEQAPEVFRTLGNLTLQIFDAFSEAMDAMDEQTIVGKLDKYDERGFQLNETRSRWEALGQSVADGFNSIPWSDLLTKGGKSLGQLTIGLLAALKAAVDGIEWGEVGKAVIDGLTSIDWVGLLNEVGNVIESILVAIVEFILGIFDGIFKTNYARDFKEWIGEQRELAENAEVASRVIEHTTDDGYNLLEAPSRWREMGLTEKDVLTFAGDYFESGSRQMKEFIYATGIAQEKLEELGLTAEDVANTDPKDLLSPSSAPSDFGMQDANDKIDKFLYQLLDGASQFEAASGHSYLLESGISNEDIATEAKRILDPTDARYTQVSATLENLGVDIDAVTSSLDNVSESAKDTADQVATSAADAEASVNDSSAKAASALGTVDVAAEVLVGTAYRLAAAVDSIQFGELGASMRHGSIAGLGAAATFGNLFHAAEGAVIPPNREFMAVFGDQRSGTNIEAPESLIRQIVREEAGSSGGSGRLESLMEELIGTVGNIRVGDDTIGRAAARYTRTHGRAVGG